MGAIFVMQQRRDNWRTRVRDVTVETPEYRGKSATASVTGRRTIYAAERLDAGKAAFARHDHPVALARARVVDDEIVARLRRIAERGTTISDVTLPTKQAGPCRSHASSKSRRTGPIIQ